MSLAYRHRLQLVEFLLSVLGWILTGTCNCLPDWKKISKVLELWTMEPWQTCVIQDVGGTQYKDFDSVLALPLEFKISRILVSISNGLGLLSLVISSLGLDCLKMEDTEQKLMKHLLLLGGVLLGMSGVLTLGPGFLGCPYQESRDEEDIPEIVSGCKIGDALFSGWFGGIFRILGGYLLLSKMCLSPDHQLPQAVCNGRYARHP